MNKWINKICNTIRTKFSFVPFVKTFKHLPSRFYVVILLSHSLIYIWFEGEIKCTGTRYITEDFIKKLTKQDNLSLVHCLNLSTTHGDKCFKVKLMTFSLRLITYWSECLFWYIFSWFVLFISLSSLRTWTSVSVFIFSTLVTTSLKNLRKWRGFINCVSCTFPITE